MRYLENGAWQPVKHTQVEVTITSQADYSYDEEYGDGESGENDNVSSTIFQKVIPLSKMGSFEFKASIPADARLSTYEIKAHVVGFEKDVDTKKFSESIRGSLRVAEFKPAELEVKVVAEKNNYLYGDKVNVTLSSNYLFGAPVKNEPVSWLARTLSYRFSPSDYDEFSFVDYSASDYDYAYSDYNSGRVFMSDSARLDEKGFARISFDLPKPDKPEPQYYQIEATVSGKSSQPISSWQNVAVHPAPCYVGIKTSDYFGYEKKPLRIDAIALTPLAQRLSGKKINVSIIRRNWISVRKSDSNGRLSWESQRIDSVCQKSVVESHSQGVDSVTFTPAISGYYIAKAQIIAGKDTLASSSISFYACGSRKSIGHG